MFAVPLKKSLCSSRPKYVLLRVYAVMPSITLLTYTVIDQSSLGKPGERKLVVYVGERLSVRNRYKPGRYVYAG